MAVINIGDCVDLIKMNGYPNNTPGMVVGKSLGSNLVVWFDERDSMSYCEDSRLIRIDPYFDYAEFYADKILEALKCS